MSIDLTVGIVRLLNRSGQTTGTGFVVTDDGLIATCAHVVEAAGAKPGDSVGATSHITNADRVGPVAFSPNDWPLGSNSGNNTIRPCTTLGELVDLACPKVRRNLTLAK